MRRRDLVILLAAASLRVSIGRADDKAPIVGVLAPDAIETEDLEAALRRAGIDPGTGVQIETLSAAGDYERLPRLAAEFVNRRVSVIRATGEAAALAAKAATTEIPIVFSSGLDPVELGLVKSYNRPGGNLTGVYLPFAAADAKRLQLLHQLVPQARVVGVLVNPKNRDAEEVERQLRAAAPTLGIELRVAEIRGPDDLAPAFADFAQHRAAAVFEATDRLLAHAWTGRIVALADAHRLPVVGVEAGQTAAGLLACYGADIDEARRVEDSYVVRILKGTKPADLPVQVTTKFDLVINLKTAKRLGLTVPPLIMAQANKVIE